MFFFVKAYQRKKRNLIANLNWTTMNHTLIYDLKENSCDVNI